MDVLAELIRDWEGPILDPYAGIGRVHELGRDDTLGIEIEPEWANEHQRTTWADSSKIVPSASDHGFLVFPRQLAGPKSGLDWVEKSTFNKVLPRPNAIVTSPDYGNRMSDQYLGTPEEQRLRAEKGAMPRRRGYAISLGRKVSPGSTAGFSFGPQYRALHAEIFTAVTGVCLPDARLALNVSDFFETRPGDDGPSRVHVVSFWVELIASLGWVVERLIPVGTRRFRDGANSDLRVDAETVIVATLKGAS